MLPQYYDLLLSVYAKKGINKANLTMSKKKKEREKEKKGKDYLVVGLLGF